MVQEDLGSGVVLLDFYADWCGPCRIMKPIVHEFAHEHPDVKVVLVNVDGDTALADKYGVSGIPCFVVLNNGEEVAREVGAISPRKLAKMVEKNK